MADKVLIEINADESIVEFIKKMIDQLNSATKKAQEMGIATTIEIATQTNEFDIPRPVLKFAGAWKQMLKSGILRIK